MSIEIKGESYETGSAGSLLLSCPSCGRDRFRQRHEKTLDHLEWEICFGCGTQLEAVKTSELTNRWIPFWESCDSILEVDN